MCRFFFLLTSFQDDKDLVHEFVVAEGLTCLIKVGAEADQNYQNYILRGTSAYKFPSRFLTPQFTAATAETSWGEACAKGGWGGASISAVTHAPAHKTIRDHMCLHTHHVN